MLPHERILDRRVQFDPKSKLYSMRSVMTEPKRFRAYSHRFVQLDQGREGACVGHSVAMEAAAVPKPYFGFTWLPGTQAKAQKAAFEIYYRARDLDGVPDHIWPEGTSLLAGCKAGVEAGYWDGYVWATNGGAEAAARMVLLWLAYEGPVMMASNWYGSMYQATKQMRFGKKIVNVFTIEGSVEGGHAYLLTRVAYMGPIFPGARLNPRNWAVWPPNSWGGEGQGWFTFDDLVRLLDEDGEAVAPVKRKLEPILIPPRVTA